MRDVWTWQDANAPRVVRNTDNAFKAQWELFLRHVALSEPFRWDLREAAKGAWMAELALESWEKRAWVDVPEL